MILVEVLYKRTLTPRAAYCFSPADTRHVKLSMSRELLWEHRLVTDNRIEANGNKNPEMINGGMRQPHCATKTTTVNRGTIHTVSSSDLNCSAHVSGSSLTRVIAGAGSTIAEPGRPGRSRGPASTISRDADMKYKVIREFLYACVFRMLFAFLLLVTI